MSWRIEDHPDGGLQITHLAAPRFTARWTTGAFPIDQALDDLFTWLGGCDQYLIFPKPKRGTPRAPHSSRNLVGG